jgi:hypothetical protein
MVSSCGLVQAVIIFVFLFQNGVSTRQLCVRALHNHHCCFNELVYVIIANFFLLFGV